MYFPCGLDISLTILGNADVDIRIEMFVSRYGNYRISYSMIFDRANVLFSFISYVFAVINSPLSSKTRDLHNTEHWSVL